MHLLCTMNRKEFHKFFKCDGPAILPVVHVLDEEQAKRNVQLAIGEGAQGVFLINHDFSHHKLLPIIASVRKEFPRILLGVNFLGVSGKNAFPVLGRLAREGVAVDAYWADNACIDEDAELRDQPYAQAIDQARKDSGWKGLYFGGTAFKGQRAVREDSYGKAASIAANFMDVVTTSGRATGAAARIKKVEDIRKGCGDAALALASGITPENAPDYATLVDCFMVATGISPPGDFYNFDPDKLRALIHVSQLSDHNAAENTAAVAAAKPLSPSDEQWYLKLIAPNTKGSCFAWLDPTSIYLNGKAFTDLTDYLASCFDPESVDLVAGIGAMGFPLGASIAYKLGKGFLALRKGGKLCVEVEQVLYSCYSGSGHTMEMRKNPFEPGTRVLIVDQWIETGGTMTGAIKLIEGSKGVVAGIATICVETKPLTRELCQKYKVVHTVSSKLQPLFDDHSFLGTMLD